MPNPRLLHRLRNPSTRLLIPLLLAACLLAWGCAMPLVETARKLDGQAERIRDGLLNSGAVDLNIGFAPGRDELPPEAVPLLNDAGKALEDLDKEDYLLQIVGHTDGTGPADANAELSLRRARAVLAYFRDHKGIPWWFMTPVGKGESEPRISPETSEADRAANRRVELRLVRKSED